MSVLPKISDYIANLSLQNQAPPLALYNLIYGNRITINGNLINNNGSTYENKIFPYVKALCDFCADPNSAIDLAFTSGYYNIFKLLLLAGGKPDSMCMFDIILYGFNDSLELVLLSGISPNTFRTNDDEVEYVLDYAVLCNNLRAVQLLLQFGANLDITNAYDYAKELKYNDILHLLHPHHMIS